MGTSSTSPCSSSLSSYPVSTVLIGLLSRPPTTITFEESVSTAVNIFRKLVEHINFLFLGQLLNCSGCSGWDGDDSRTNGIEVFLLYQNLQVIRQNLSGLADYLLCRFVAECLVVWFAGVRTLPHTSCRKSWDKFFTFISPPKVG